MDESFPDWLVPMAATLTQQRFTAEGWLFERKLDGIRLLAFKRGNDVRLLSRNALPQQHPALAAAIAALPRAELILDGELTWSRAAPGYHVFDVLWHDGRVTDRALDDRRALLQGLPLEPPLHRVESLADEHPWERACREGWEGVIAKRRDAPYEHRRSRHWLKMKCELQQDFVIGGFTDPQGSRVGLGALLVGYFEASDFVFAGKVGTGFDTAMLRELRTRLDATEIAASPFTRAFGLARVRAHWVRPEQVVRLAFIEWTAHDKLRHSRLLEIDVNRSPRDVTRATS